VLCLGYYSHPNPHFDLHQMQKKCIDDCKAGTGWQPTHIAQLWLTGVSQSVDLDRSNNPNTTPTKDYENVRVVVCLRGVQRGYAEGERGSTPTGRCRQRCRILLGYRSDGRRRGQGSGLFLKPRKCQSGDWVDWDWSSDTTPRDWCSKGARGLLMSRSNGRWRIDRLDSAWA